MVRKRSCSGPTQLKQKQIFFTRKKHVNDEPYVLDVSELKLH